MSIFNESGLMFLPSLLPAMGWLLGYTPLLVYGIARWRSYREQQPADPQLGLKVALGFFRFLGLHVALLGAAIALHGLFDSDGSVRLGLALLVPGVLVFGAHVAALARTSAGGTQVVARLYAGLLLLQLGALGFCALVVLSVVIAMSDTPASVAHVGYAFGAVYVPAWIVQLLRFQRA